jgi:TRAP-type C4-dicarboxylate transport system permease small subunit
MTDSPRARPLRTAAAVLLKIEDLTLVGLLTVMVGLALAQILLRNFFSQAILWADPAVRVMVLWIGMVGSMIGSRRGEHIAVDAVARYLPERYKAAAAVAVDLITSGICGLLVYHGFRFVRMEHEFSTIAFGRVPTWVTAAVIPFGFAVIGLRYLFLAGRHLSQIKPESS